MLRKGDERDPACAPDRQAHYRALHGSATHQGAICSSASMNIMKGFLRRDEITSVIKFIGACLNALAKCPWARPDSDGDVLVLSDVMS